ncbi:MAG TPA: hypothetical protein VG146_15220 [Verrucomicrobiae bacterium]|nr:hypothetical protein [Verrucomicrobiae bacterium]
MKTLPKMGISHDLNSQINEGMTISGLCQADVIRQALRIGLPQLAARFQRPPCGWRSGFAKRNASVTTGLPAEAGVPDARNAAFRRQRPPSLTDYREALVERAEPTTLEQFEKGMKAIADGR